MGLFVHEVRIYPTGGQRPVPVDLHVGGDRITRIRPLGELQPGPDDTVLEGAFVPDSHIGRVVPAGAAVIEAIRRDTAADNLARAVVLDAAASEMVDAALDWMEAFFAQDLRRESRRLTKSRFSCGYGDLALENQKLFHDLLDLKRFGVELTEQYILVPEKSVTAVAGIETTH